MSHDPVFEEKIIVWLINHDQITIIIVTEEYETLKKNYMKDKYRNKKKGSYF